MNTKPPGEAPLRQVKLNLMGVSKPRAEVVLARLANGLEAGIVGGLAMLVLLIAGSILRGEWWWAPANLLGSTFYGTR